MKILCHRGYWNDASEKNSVAALSRAIEYGYGFESDVRDYRGSLVISHDVADQNAPALKDVFKLLSASNDQFCFAINVKADGLAAMLKNLLSDFGLKNYFAFDMSVPQMLWYRTLGLRFFTRQSEFETAPTLYDDATGIWIDAFDSEEWLTPQLIKDHLSNGKEVCIVSSELHERDPKELWSKLKPMSDCNIYLCTDRPTEAEKFFWEVTCLADKSDHFRYGRSVDRSKRLAL